VRQLFASYLDRYHRICLDWARKHYVKPRERWVVREKLTDGTIQVIPTWDKVSFPTWTAAREAIDWIEEHPTATYEQWLEFTSRNAS